MDGHACLFVCFFIPEDLELNSEESQRPADFLWQVILEIAQLLYFT